MTRNAPEAWRRDLNGPVLIRASAWTVPRRTAEIQGILPQLQVGKTTGNAFSCSWYGCVLGLRRGQDISQQLRSPEGLNRGALGVLGFPLGRDARTFIQRLLRPGEPSGAEALRYNTGLYHKELLVRSRSVEVSKRRSTDRKGPAANRRSRVQVPAALHQNAG